MLLEQISEYFYDPAVCWSAPRVLVALQIGFRRLRAWVRRRRAG